MSKLIPLSSLLKEVSACLYAVRKGRSLSEVLPNVATHKPAVQALIFYVLRQYYLSLAVSKQLLSKKAPNAQFEALLLSALALLLPSVGEQAPVYASFTVVDEALKAASKLPKTAPYKSLLNACLRRFLRESEALLSVANQDLEAFYGFPLWWQARLKNDYPQTWSEILRTVFDAGPMSLRVNQRQYASAQAYAQKLQALGLAVEQVGDCGLILKRAVPVGDLPEFAQGACSVQDLGAQQAAMWLPLQNGLKVLDACSAPGGKTAHILERTEVALTALDVDPVRLASVQDNLQRLQLLNTEKVQLFCADATDASDVLSGKQFDVILADVPCSASGIVRRHPDIRLLRRESDIDQLASLQRKIISNLWQYLKPGGHLLYATCSVFSQENHLQAQWMLTQFPARLVRTEQLLPNAKHDGFFYALFEKTA